MSGVLINCGGVVLGTIVGLLFKKLLLGHRKVVVMQALGICVLMIGISDTLKVENMLFLILSVVVGSFFGSLFRIEHNLEKFSDFLAYKITKSDDNTVGQSFITGTLIFCVGAMAIYGSIQAGLGDDSTLITKTVLDTVTAACVASTLGWGVVLSIFPLFILQGSIALLASFIQPFVTEVLLNQLSAIGGILVACIGINMLEIKKIHTADMLPAIFGALLMLV